MKLTEGVNQTLCSQFISIFQNDRHNETLDCSSMDDKKAPNEVLYIIELLLAPIFACLTIAMFLLMVFVASQISEYFSKLLTCFGEKVKPKNKKENERKRSIVLVKDIEQEPPRKPPRFSNSRT